MEKSGLAFVVVLVLISLNSCRPQMIAAECGEGDRAALLDFKAAIVKDPSGALKPA